jgi:HSP20 family protein
MWDVTQHKEDNMSVRDLIPWGRERGLSVRSGEYVDPFVSLQREVNRLFNDFSPGFDVPMPTLGFGALGGAGWPRTDVY